MSAFQPQLIFLPYLLLNNPLVILFPVAWQMLQPGERKYMKIAYLVLEDGRVFEGFKFGADTESIGELVFTTGMGGYIETLTDPSYYGQIIMQTFPLIGNYGIIEDDFEGRCRARGYVIREACDIPSNFRSGYNLDTFLKGRGIVGLCGVDTRQLTKIIREHGVMNAMICDSIPKDMSHIRNYYIKDAVLNVTCDTEEEYQTDNGKFKVTLVDYGTKQSIITALLSRGCSVRVVPANLSADDIIKNKPDGIMLSNGPGDPAENVYQIEQLRILFGKLPIFGIGLGHQLLALAAGNETVKHKYGHRGANQPVREVFGTRTFITSQNHGYIVDKSSIKNGRMIFENANDGTCEGIEYPEQNALSVQFYPEVSAGPHNTAYLFDRFIELIKSADRAACKGGIN